jgi:hypothetical protein
MFFTKLRAQVARSDFVACAVFAGSVRAPCYRSSQGSLGDAKNAARSINRGVTMVSKLAEHGRARAMGSLLPALLFASVGSASLASHVALADRTIQQGFDRNQCSNGMCTILRVLIELNGDAATPIVSVARRDFVYGPSVFNFDTVVQRASDVCTKDVVVPQDVFTAVGAVFKSISSGGTPPPVLTPTQQTLLLFYTTLLQQTQGFECSPRDLGDVEVPDTSVQPGLNPGSPYGVPPVYGNNGYLPPAPLPYIPGNVGGVIFQ